MGESSALGLDKAPFPLTPALSPRRGRIIFRIDRACMRRSCPERHASFPLLGERVGVRGKEAAVESRVLGLDEAQLPLTPARSPAERENRFPHRQRLGAAGEEQDSASIFPLLGERVGVRGMEAMGESSALGLDGVSFPLTPDFARAGRL